MKAIAVIPGQANSVHLADIPRPRLTDIPDGLGVLVKVLRVGVDGTDKEINAAEYGAAPPGENILVIGHESFGVVEEVGEHVTELAPGDFVVIDQFFDRTRHRVDTFFEDGVVAHVMFADPVCADLRAACVQASTEIGIRVHDGGTYLNMAHARPASSLRQR